MNRLRTPILVIVATAIVSISVVVVWFLDIRLKRAIDVSITQSSLSEDKTVAALYGAIIATRIEELTRDLRTLSNNASIRTGAGETCSSIASELTDELSVSAILRTTVNGVVDCASSSVALGKQLDSTDAIESLKAGDDHQVAFGRGMTVTHGESGQQFVLPVHVALRAENGEYRGSLGAEIISSTLTEQLAALITDPGTFILLDDDGSVVMHSNSGLLGRNVEVEDAFQIHGVKALTKEDLQRFRVASLSEVFGIEVDRSLVSSAQVEILGRKLTVLHIVSTERLTATVDPVNRARSLMFWVVTGIFLFLILIGMVIMSRWNRDTSSQVKSATGDMEQKVRDATMIAEDYEIYKQALDVAEDNISIANAEGNAVYLNTSFSKVTGFSPKEALWKKVGTLWGKQMDEAYYKRMWQAIKVEKRAFVDTITNRRKDGTTYRASISITPVKNEADEVTHYIAVERPLDPLPRVPVEPTTEKGSKKPKKKGA